ncbi:MAG: hypothetical protein ACJA06_000002 [Halocynthiibacter sp.]|jgi:hypothetical protein
MNIRDNLLVTVIGVTIIAPATFILGLYWLTKDPTLRPLGITEAKLASAGMTEHNGAILTTISIAEGIQLDTSREELERTINNAFDMYDTESRFNYVRAPSGKGVSVTYTIGKNQFGPFPIKHASEGIRPAALAHSMLVKHVKSVDQKRRQNMSLIERVFAE